MLYIFDKDDRFKNILSEENGLIDTHFKDYQNHLVDGPFIFYVDSYSPLLDLIVAENQVAFYDRDDELRLMRIKEIYESVTSDGSIVTAKCEPSYLELYDHFIEDRRFVDKTAQEALTAALQGSRYSGEVTVNLGIATTNYYWTNGIDAIFTILNTWGGALKDTITLNDENEIVERKIMILQRLGADNGLIVEPDYNAESVERKTLSYPKTAMWGQGASLETEGGGHTRYITFEDVEWKKSKGDPVDKPKGQKWVGDPQALAIYGYLESGVRKHREGHFSNQDYDDPEELLKATWDALQEQLHAETTHEATIDVKDRKVSLGDTVTTLVREFNKSIELQSQVTGLEYSILDMDKDVKIVVGKYVDMSENPMQQQLDDLEKTVDNNRGKWDAASKPINRGRYPDIKPNKPTNLRTEGAFQTIQLYWDYTDEIYVEFYEVYGSKISDFAPDSQHLLYRGKVSAFGHGVNTDETWYYYVRAVNYHGRGSDYSDRVSASTVRVVSDDILFGGILADHLTDNLDIADKLAQNTIDRINQGLMQEIQYTQDEIEAVNTALTNRLNDEIGDITSQIDSLLQQTSNIEGTVTNITNDIDTINGTLSTTITQLSNLGDTVSKQTLDIQANAEGLTAKADRTELTNYVDKQTYNSKMASIDVSINGIDQIVQNVQADVSNVDGRVNNAFSEISRVEQDATQVSQTVSELRGDFENEATLNETRFTQLSDQINFEVVHKTNVLSSINLSQEGVRIDGTKVHISGQTLIDDAVIGTAAIADAAITRAHLGQAIITSAHVDYLTGQKLVANSVNADKLNVTELSAITGNLGIITSGRIETLEIAGATNNRIYFGYASNPDGIIRHDGVGMRLSADLHTYYRVRDGGINPGSSVQEILHTWWAGDRNSNHETILLLGKYGNSTQLRVPTNSLIINANKSGSDIYLQCWREIKVTRPYDPSTHAPIRASNFYQSSSIKFKTNIEYLNRSALDIINQLTVVEYDLIDDFDAGRQVGFIAEDSPSISTIDNEAINTYKLTAYNTKAIQDLDKKMTKHTSTIEWLKLENQYLKQKIKILEEKVA